jgi:hypothetical protein
MEGNGQRQEAEEDGFVIFHRGDPREKGARE